MDICRPDLIVQIKVLLLKSAPILLDVGCRVWQACIRVVDLLIDLSTTTAILRAICSGCSKLLLLLLLLHLNITTLG